MHFRRAPDRHQAPSARLFRGSKSSRRIDFEERIRIAICRPPKFCSYSKPRSTVSSTSNLEASAAVRRSTVLESSETSVSSGLALRDRASDFADAGKHIRQEGSSSKLADKCGLGVLKRGNGVLAADRGKILEEFVQSVSCFEVVARKRLRGTSLSSSIRTSPSLTRMALSI